MMLLLRYLILFSVLSACTATAARVQEPAQVSSISEFRTVSREVILAAEEPLPVRFRATVLYSDPGWKVTFVTGDADSDSDGLSSTPTRKPTTQP